MMIRRSIWGHKQPTDATLGLRIPFLIEECLYNTYVSDMLKESSFHNR